MASALFRYFFRLTPSFLSPLSLSCTPIFLSLLPFSSSSSSLNLSPQQNPQPFLPQKVPYLLNQCRNMSQLQQIQAYLITSGRFQNPFLASKLLKLSIEFGDLGYSLLIFGCLSFPDRVCVNTMIKAYCTSSSPQKGVIFYFETMKNEVFSPNSFTFPPLLGCCAKMGCVYSGMKCHGQAVKNGFDCVLPVRNSLIYMYGCCGSIELGLDVFDEMLERDLVSWNSIIDGFAKVGDLRRAHSMFDVMPERNEVSWNVMISGYLKGNNPGFVLKLFREMVKAGRIENNRTIVSVVNACGRSARLKEGASIHGFLIRSLWDLSLMLNTAFIDMYSKCGKVEMAQTIFDRLTEKNLVCWNSMILGYCLHGDPEKGLTLFANMVGGTILDVAGTNHGVNVGNNVGGGLHPDEITFVGVLCACTRAGLLAEGRNYFQMMNVFSIKPNFAHYWCMANLLASHGLVQEALDTVQKVTELDDDISSESLVWASLLGSCRFQGDVSLGEQVAKVLIKLEPHNIMCYALLFNVYAAAGKWEDAANVKSMIKDREGGRVPSCSLLDLIEIVHSFKFRDEKQEGTHIVMMMDALAQRLRLSDAHLEQSISLDLEYQT